MIGSHLHLPKRVSNHKVGSPLAVEVPEGWVYCPILEYHLHPVACSQRGKDHKKEPSRNLCDPECLHLRTPPKAVSGSEVFYRQGANQRDGYQARIRNFVCVGVPGESCSVPMTRAQARCPRHQKKWAKLRRLGEASNLEQPLSLS